MQDLASLHASMLGVGIKQLWEQNLTWFLSGTRLQINSLPIFGDIIIGKTWPSAQQNKLALREFQFLNHDGDSVAVATTSWFLINVKNKIPVDPKEFLKKLKVESSRVIQDPFEKLPEFFAAENEAVFEVRLSDLDVNKHVNNVSYIEWALESIPLDNIRNQFPADIIAYYKKEAFYGDCIISRIQKLEDDGQKVFLHQLIREGDERELALLKSSWISRRNK
jgi:acyl-ACP thioesterase